ncbi:MAG: ATP-binding protein [Acidobacteriota bacterium]|nr:ATP-binding protein [Acidobacteriota bacterium]
MSHITAFAMSLLEVLQLVGYSMGAVLPLWMSVLLARQRSVLAAQERVLMVLAISIGLWHTSNLLLTLHSVLPLEPQRWLMLLRVADTIAVVSITFSYSFLLHVHLHLWAESCGRGLTKFERARVWMSYIPVLFLVVSVPPLWRGEYAPMLSKLSAFVLPFGLWAVYVLGLVAATDWLIARRSRETGERRLMRTLAASFIAIAGLLLAVHVLGVGRGTTLESYLVTLANLGSLLPTALIAYHIYRYRYLALLIRESLVVASFAAVVLVVYLYGIRTLEGWLTARYQLRPGVVETLLILGFVLLAAPLRRWLDKRFQKLFAREAALYRELVTRIGAQAGRFKHLPELLSFIEERTAQELGLRRVCIYAGGAELPSDNDEDEEARGTAEAWKEQAMHEAVVNAGGVVENSTLLRQHGFELAYALRREENVVGLLLVDAAREVLTPDVRAVLEVLAGQVAIAIEDCRLVEENIKLERRLAQGERLAELGQMAATVAHEVKNPLSAIKSIAQVMREDERLADEYTRDLDLIVGETERLSRSVSQLLNFARYAPANGGPSVSADEMARALVSLFHSDAQVRGIEIDLRADAREAFSGTQAAAVRDALTNLLHNALQATPAGGRILIEVTRESTHLKFTVLDSGQGVPLALHRRIWEPFYTTKQRGTGLGLAIVRKRMEEIGGQAQLVPYEEGQGAKFELRVPFDSARVS